MKKIKPCADNFVKARDYFVSDKPIGYLRYNPAKVYFSIYKRVSWLQKRVLRLLDIDVVYDDMPKIVDYEATE